MSLYDGLMAMVDDESFAKMDNDQKSSDIIRFMVNALMACGHKRERILASGYLGEAWAAADKGMIINPKGQGADMKDKNGVPMEIKVTNSALGTKVNVNLFVPKYNESVPLDTYYDDLRKMNKMKGDVHVQHTYKHDKKGMPMMNIYVFGHDFISFYMRFVECHTKDKVNIGGLGCNICTKVHRLLYFEDLETRWRASPEKFDKTLFKVVVTGSCPASASPSSSSSQSK